MSVGPFCTLKENEATETVCRIIRSWRTTVGLTTILLPHAQSIWFKKETSCTWGALKTANLSCGLKLLCNSVYKKQDNLLMTLPSHTTWLASHKGCKDSDHWREGFEDTLLQDQTGTLETTKAVSGEGYHCSSSVAIPRRTRTWINKNQLSLLCKPE